MSKRSRKNPENENKTEKETVVLEEPSLSSITNKTYSKPTVIRFTTSQYTDVPLTTSATWGLRENPVKPLPKYHVSRINKQGDRVFESHYDSGNNIWGGISKRKRSKRKQSKRKRSKSHKKTKKSRRVRQR